MELCSRERLSWSAAPGVAVSRRSNAELQVLNLQIRLPQYQFSARVSHMKSAHSFLPPMEFLCLKLSG
jgi:hypothetical protein